MSFCSSERPKCIASALLLALLRLGGLGGLLSLCRLGCLLRRLGLFGSFGWSLLRGQLGELPGIVLMQRAGTPALALVLLRQRLHDRDEIVDADPLQLA